MSERPDYVPLLWNHLPFWSWIAARPRRVLIWHVVEIVWTIPLVVFAATYGSTLVLVCLLIAVVSILVRAGIYIPLARQAMREEREDSGG